MPRSNSNNSRTTFRPLLSKAALTAIQKTWSAPMLSLGRTLANIPARDFNSFDAWGFVFAIDTLRDNQPALRALLEVAEEFEVRPTFDEIFGRVDQLLALRVEVKAFIKNRRQQQNLKTTQFGFMRGPRPEEKVGFVRGPRAADTLEFKLTDKEDVPVGHIFAAKACLNSSIELSGWEQGFLKGMQRHTRPSPKQKEALAEICKKCQVRWA